MEADRNCMVFLNVLQVFDRSDTNDYFTKLKMLRTPGF